MLYSSQMILFSYSKAHDQDAYFESVIAINLTSMLVLVALFVQVSKYIFVGIFRGWYWFFHKILSTISNFCEGERGPSCNCVHQDDRHLVDLQSCRSLYPHRHSHLHGHSETVSWKQNIFFLLNIIVFLFSLKGMREMKIHHHLLNLSKAFQKFIVAPL